jgi:SSS family solute:Na+ symporter
MESAAAAAVQFSSLDWGVVLFYLAFGLGLGLYYSRTNTSTAAFFLGGGAMPGWALGLSLVATSISSNTFLAMPALSYADDFHLLSKDFPIAPVLLFAGVFLVPLWRGEPTPAACTCGGGGGGSASRQWSTPFEFLEARFGSSTRTYVACLFVINQMLRGGAVLYLVSLPLALAMGISANLAIVLTGS